MSKDYDKMQFAPFPFDLAPGSKGAEVVVGEPSSSGLLPPAPLGEHTDM